MDVSRVRGLFEGIASGYETHRPLLAEAVVRTQGAIIELGMGEGSTRALHAVSDLTDRTVWSYDHDLSWFSRFVELRSERHLLACVRSWDDCPLESMLWSLAFVDHAPAERRIVELRRLAWRAHVVVVHDTEDPAYGYDAAYDLFTYRLDDKRFPQWTTALSNYVDVSRWSIA